MCALPQRDRFLNDEWRGGWDEPRAAWWMAAAKKVPPFEEWPVESRNRLLKWVMSDEPADRC